MQVNAGDAELAQCFEGLAAIRLRYQHAKMRPSGVMGIEYFLKIAEQATGVRPSSLANVRFELPIKLLRNKPAKVRVKRVSAIVARIASQIAATSELDSKTWRNRAAPISCIGFSTRAATSGAGSKG